MGRPRKQQGGTIVTCVALPEATRKQIDLRADEQGKTLSDVIRPVLELHFTPLPITETMAKLETQSVEEWSLNSAAIGQKLAEANAKSEQQLAYAKAELDKSKAEAEAKAAQVLSDAKAELDKSKAEAEAKMTTAKATRSAQKETIASMWANSRECSLLAALQEAGVYTSEPEPKLVKMPRTLDEKLAAGQVLASKYMLQQGIVGYEYSDRVEMFNGAAYTIWQTLSKRRYSANLHGALSEIASLAAIEVSEDWQDCLAAELSAKAKMLVTPEQAWSELGWTLYYNKPGESPIGQNCLTKEDEPSFELSKETVSDALRKVCQEFGTTSLEGKAYAAESRCW